jgi:hypothetical protein
MGLTVTAEVAGSSPVVPAIKPKIINGLWQVASSRGIREGAGEGADAISTLFLFCLRTLRGC